MTNSEYRIIGTLESAGYADLLFEIFFLSTPRTPRYQPHTILASLTQAGSNVNKQPSPSVLFPIPDVRYDAMS